MVERGVLGLALFLVACQAPAARERVPAPATRPAEPPWPRFAERPALEALGRIALACYQRALTHDPVFAKGGRLVIRWRADRRGDLLQLEFDIDTFGSWEIQPSGQTLAECVVAGARTTSVRWPREGVAPLRLSP